MAQAFIGVGSNLGDRNFFIQEALQKLRKKVRVQKVSSLRETLPFGVESQPNFLNGVVKIQTHLSPQDLLEELLEIEKSLGRVRTKKWEPRNIDLDLLSYDQVILCEKNLVLPHPRMHERLFVLEPLVEIDPDWVHPVLFKTSLQLLLENRKQSTLSN